MFDCYSVFSFLPADNITLQYYYQYSSSGILTSFILNRWKEKDFSLSKHKNDVLEDTDRI